MRSVVCPYCERKFWVEEQAVLGQDQAAGEAGEIQVAGWRERSVVRGYATELPSVYKRAIELDTVNTADGARRRFEIWERAKPDARGYLLTIAGWTAQGRAKKKDFKIGQKGLFTVNKGNGGDGRSWTKLSALELERRKPRNSALTIDKGLDKESKGWLPIRLGETKPALLDDKSQLNEPLVREMIQAWAMCWDPDYLR
jgi:hypothetical protein